MAERPVRAAFPELRHAEAAALNATLIDRALPADQARVASVVRSPLDSGWYRTEVLEVQSDSGEVAKVFLKDFGSVDKGKSRMEDRRERERYFYGRVFPDGSLGLPRYIGEIWGPDRFWLLLEYIDAVPLKWCELDVWFQAAAWLGRFQTMTARKLEELDASGRFTKHGPEYFENASIRAVKGSARFGADVVSTVERAVPVYLEYAAGLMRSPRALVHGAFRPAQVLVEEKATGPRICPVDWEISAIGSCLYDLAVLADGFEGSDLESFLDCFLAGASWLHEAPPTLIDLQAAITACRMHRTMKWLGAAQARGMSEKVVRDLAGSLLLAPAAPLR